MSTTQIEQSTYEIRCPEESCRSGCSRTRKFLAAILNFPLELVGRGIVLRVPCPNRKSYLIRIDL